MRKQLANVVRWTLVFLVQLVAALLKLPDELAPWLARVLAVGEEPAKRVLNVLLVVVPLVLAAAGPSLLRSARWLVSKFHRDAEIDFTSRLWPATPPNRINTDEILRNTWFFFRDQCKAKLDSIRSQLSDGEPVMLPQHFVAYATLKDFYNGKPAVELPPACRLQPDALPPLTQCSWTASTGTAVAIVGEAGSGKSYALLHQLSTHLSRDPDKTALPVYLDLADWKNLVVAEGGNQLERWVHKSIRQEYARVLSSNEAIWLLHSSSRGDVNVVLCLDGLDELPLEDQKECLDAILDYTGNRGHVVFTCRRQELRSLIEPLVEQPEGPKCWVFALPELATAAQCEEALLLMQSTGKYTDSFLAQFQAGALQELVNTPLLLNLYLKVMNEQPDFDPAVLRARPGQQHPTNVYEILWAEYEAIQYKVLHKRPARFWRPDFGSSLRTGLYYIAVQAGSNSFRLDTIQPYTWLNQVQTAPAEQGQLGRVTTDLALARILFNPLPIQWYYLVSRLLVGILLALAAGCLLAQYSTFLGDGILIGWLTAGFTLWRTYRPAALAAPPAGTATGSARWARWTLSVREWLQQHAYTLQVVAFVSALMISCGLYEGFKVPRRAGDMQLWGTFSITQAIFGMTTGLMAGTVLGFRHTYTRDTDISLVERPAFRWLVALRTGLVVGWVCLGSVMGIIGAILIRSFPGTTLGSWLATALPTWRQYLHNWLFLSPGMSNLAAVFAVAFLVGGAVGFVLVTLLAVLDRQQSIIQVETEPPGNRTATRSVAQLAWYATLRGIVVALAVLGALLVMTRDGWHFSTRGSRFGMMAIGAGLVAFLWFGGVEFIQHYTLRVQLALLQLLPLRFKDWLRAARKMAFILSRSGSAIKFRHATLLEYLQKPPGTVVSTTPLPSLSLPPATHRAWKLLRISLLPCFAVLLSLPLLRRFLPAWPTGTFWSHANALDLRPATGLRVLNDSTIRVLQAGQLDIIVQGQVNVGDIVGSVGPQGTAYGFLGIPLDHAYDRFRTAEHGALFYRIHRPAGLTAWRPLRPVPMPGFFMTSSAWVSSLSEQVQPGELVQFAINDAEWQNNSGTFTLTFETCSIPAKTPQQKAALLTSSALARSKKTTLVE
jgi:hypothetical protein